jgi:hypothetical protein
VIGRVLNRGRNVHGALRYLFGPGRANEHVNQRLVAAWQHHGDIEPPVMDNGERDVRRLAALLTQSLVPLGDRAPAEPVWHCIIRAAPEDREVDDPAWLDITQELMHRLGLSARGREHEGVRWVAVAHGDNHVHVVATMARQDGRRAHVDREYIKVGEAMRWAERTYNLRVLIRRDGTAPSRPSRAEQEKARRTGRSMPPRVTLRRKVEAAAVAAFARASPARPGERP